MQQEQQAKSDYNFDNYKEDDVLALKRQEAKEIYKQFRQLSEKNEPGMALQSIQEFINVKSTFSNFIYSMKTIFVILE